MDKSLEQKIRELEKRVNSLEILVKVVGGAAYTCADVLSSALIVMSNVDRRHRHDEDISRLVGALQTEHDRLRMFLPAEAHALPQ